MAKFTQSYLPVTGGKANPKQMTIVSGLSSRPFIGKVGAPLNTGEKNIRVTVLTNEMVRVEVSTAGVFEDMPTQKVWFRNFEHVHCSFTISQNILHIKTENTSFYYNVKKEKMHKILLGDSRTVTNFKRGNLGGTARTLDGATGAVDLGDGLVSRSGVTKLDDSTSLVLDEQGMVVPRSHKERDTYYFAYGTHYRRCISDLFRLTGAVPLIPRWSLGNWWSRYKVYTQEEYKDVMKRFMKEEIPITIATIDMDWHWVDVAKRFGDDAKLVGIPDTIQGLATRQSGWTGYSWNTELFPDYKEFLAWLQDHGFKTTMNLHPADGVRPFEDMYANMAQAMGIDPETKQTIAFDITDKKFIEAYFDVLHRPYEEDGVDFWWIDWQQGKKTKVEGLDPLWALNHYHFLDHERNNKRGLILSRYAEVGSHRYPIGFSGDTLISWRILDAQPHFTSTASNVGYTWWSHDIGGHHFGKKDDELFLRWVQYGVFSPMMRLHSTSNEFMGKEPWKTSSDTQRDLTDYLRLRHRLIPYIYTMNARTHFEGIALCEPMYYSYPNEEMAYNAPNQYTFGSEIMVAPITEKMDPETLMAGTDVWFPKGRFTDFFTGRIYKGGRSYRVFRGQESIPVFAKAGAIIPLDSQGTKNIWQNPESLDLYMYRGNGSFTLYEDDGESKNFEKGEVADTVFSITEMRDDVEVTIHKVLGNIGVVPRERQYRIRLRDIRRTEKIEVTIDGKEQDITCKVDGAGLMITLPKVLPSETVIVKLTAITPCKNVEKKEALIELISKFQNSYRKRSKTYTDFVHNPTDKIPGSKKFKPLIQEILDLDYDI